MAEFWPKSKAIGLHFCPKLSETNMGQLFAKKNGDEKWPIFCQKVRLIFLPKIESDLYGPTFCRKIFGEK